MQNQQSPQQPVFIKPVKKSKAPLIIALTLGGFFLIIIVIFFAFLMSGLFSSDGKNNPTGFSHETVGVLHINGTIAQQSVTPLFSPEASYNHEYILNAIYTMTEDENNSGLILYINSPGGELIAVDDVYHALLAYKETNRPIYAYCANYAASGGYYLATIADKIWAHSLCTTGSIGVSYGEHMDFSEFCSKHGIEVTPLISDNNKAMGSLFQPLTDEQKAIYQSQIDEYYDLFVDTVVAGRPNLTRDQIITLADGRTYTATQAKANGLIDDIARYDVFLNKFYEENAIDKNIPCVDYIYVPTDAFSGMFLSANDNLTTQTGEDLLYAYIDAFRTLQGPLVYAPR